MLGFGQVLHQGAMDKDVPAPDLAEEQAARSVIQKPNQANRNIALYNQQKTKCEVLNHRQASTKQSPDQGYEKKAREPPE